MVQYQRDSLRSPSMQHGSPGYDTTLVCLLCRHLSQHLFGGQSAEQPLFRVALRGSASCRLSLRRGGRMGREEWGANGEARLHRDHRSLVSGHLTTDDGRVTDSDGSGGEWSGSHKEAW